MPHRGPTTIVHPSDEKNKIPTTFQHFRAKYATIGARYKSYNYEHYFIKTVMQFQGKPHKSPRAIVKSSGEKYFTNKLLLFLREIFFIISKLSVARSRHIHVTNDSYFTKPFLCK